MKNNLTIERTLELIELGFDDGRGNLFKTINKEYHQKIPTYNIYDLLSFLQNKEEIFIHWSPSEYGGYWYVDYGFRRVGIDNELIDALFFACKQLKIDGVL